MPVSECGKHSTNTRQPCGLEAARTLHAYVPLPLEIDQYVTAVFAAACGIDSCNTFQVTGHTATAVLGSQMMVLGGGNKTQFHSCRHVLVYDPIERTWSKLATRGNAPAALIYHRWLLSLSLAKYSSSFICPCCKRLISTLCIAYSQECFTTVLGLNVSI